MTTCRHQSDGSTEVASSPDLRSSQTPAAWRAILDSGDRVKPGHSGLATKVRKTVTLDEDLVAEFGGKGDDRQLSPEINAVLRAEKARRDRLRSLEDLLDRLDAERGPVDPDLVAHFEDLIR